ncbi:OmpA family protein [Gluconacetobacter diazotrophicus]|uniref:OmpA-like domain-containing protein n=2 Tax=Gluconacetobacter diazotrophicus TaxID=33996 RepID=A9HCQ9_GLUDA|nr:hypothetical protein [Gluconacetobacter diazotrophicus]CAP54978.1 conserved hypothetical protein [Gluconacetobacter diazotrophicus PA1 5]
MAHAGTSHDSARPPVCHAVPPRRGRAPGLALAALLALGGCGHRDAFDATLDWWHEHQGGVIAQQRPPPPGAHEAYPAVGLTPTTPPVLPSEDLRAHVTETLVEQRNLAHREGAEIGPLTLPAPPATGAPPQAAAPARPAAPAPADGGASSAVLVAADAPPPPPAASPAPARAANETATGTPAAPPTGATSGTADGTASGEALVAMPEVGADVGGVGGKPPPAPVPIPEIPAQPPMPPSFPGFVVPADNALATPPRPDYALSDPEGTRIRFPIGTDQPLQGQAGTIASLARQAPNGPFFVHGYGEAPSTDAAAQARAMTLALLRARAVAELLAADGVPARAIHLRGHPFGDGVRISRAR